MMKNSLKYIVFFVFATLSLFSCRGGKASSGTDIASVVVATSSWTAAYARAAGAENIVVLAPFEMEHPSEYELRPGDIPKLMDAKVIVYAGYEVMTERLKKGLELPQDKLLLVDTDYSYATIEKSVMDIAVKLGTEDTARKNLSDIRRMFEEGRDAVNRKKMSEQPVIVHRFQASVAKELGLIPVVLFGPAAPEASEIAVAAGTQALLIIDNFHNPAGLSFREVLPDTRYVQLLNFPGLKGTKILTDVIRYNVSQIVQN
ncbi:MAG: hypothetical protein LBG96_01780 [Tannerella sp.]|jgi:hypothetical protein|nr:hypothetical protein [Tannerella sp.]